MIEITLSMWNRLNFWLWNEILWWMQWCVKLEFHILNFFHEERNSFCYYCYCQHHRSDIVFLTSMSPSSLLNNHETKENKILLNWLNNSITIKMNSFIAFTVLLTKKGEWVDLNRDHCTEWIADFMFMDKKRDRDTSNNSRWKDNGQYLDLYPDKHYLLFVAILLFMIGWIIMKKRRKRTYVYIKKESENI